MSYKVRPVAVAASVCLAMIVGRPAVAESQTAPAASSAETLIITGDVTETLTIKPADLKTMPRTAVTVSEEGRQVTYEGVLVGELLKRAGAPVGRDLSGKAVATYVRASAKDGYHVVFSLAELDPSFTSNDIIVADTIDGKPLFYDTRLSANGTQSCGTCHQQARAFTDGRPRAIGSTGELHPRGSMSLVNVAYAAALTWGNPTITRLEDQALVPMFGKHPIELGLQRPGTEWLEALRGDPRYQPLFARAFGAAPDLFSIADRRTVAARSAILQSVEVRVVNSLNSHSRGRSATLHGGPDGIECEKSPGGDDR